MDTENKSLTIVGLEATNIKRLRAVRLEVKGESVVIVGGQNAQGKTSLLDAIQMTIGGGKLAERPIRDGASKGEIVLDLGDLIATRRFSAKGSALTVTDKDKNVLASPQSILDRLTSKISFDPLAFLRMEPKAKAETLKKITGLDFTGLDMNRAQIFTNRTAKNQQVKQAAALADTAPRYDDMPEEPVSISDLSKRLSDAETVLSENNRKRDSLSDANDKVDAADTAVMTAEEELKRAQASLALKKAAKETAIKARDSLAEEIKLLADPDKASILTQLQDIEATNAKIRANEDWKKRQQELAVLTKESADMTEKLENIDAKKAAMLAEVKFPIEGLSFDEGGILYNSVPFDQASGAEQLRVSVAMGLAMNPELKVLLIRDGSLLDDKSLSIVAKMAEESGSQIWLERVGKGEECSVIIEDGAIEEDRTPAGKKKAAQLAEA